MICFFNGQGSQPIQPLLPQAAPQVGLNGFDMSRPRGPWFRNPSLILAYSQGTVTAA